MKNQVISFLILIAMLVMPATRTLSQDLADANPRLDDVLRALANIPAKARPIEFRKGSATFLEGRHFQGVQSVFDPSANKQTCFVTHDSAT